jgi:hypothetical protein
MISSRSLALTFAILWVATLHADHAPEWIMARGKPETTLFGISIDGGTLGAVKRKFGKPDSVERFPDGGEALYRFRFHNAPVEVSTMYSPANKGTDKEWSLRSS